MKIRLKSIDASMCRDAEKAQKRVRLGASEYRGFRGDRRASPEDTIGG
jgi:hypothetical protein